MGSYTKTYKKYFIDQIEKLIKNSVSKPLIIFYDEWWNIYRYCNCDCNLKDLDNYDQFIFEDRSFHMMAIFKNEKIIKGNWNYDITKCSRDKALQFLFNYFLHMNYCTTDEYGKLRSDFVEPKKMKYFEKSNMDFNEEIAKIKSKIEKEEM